MFEMAFEITVEQLNFTSFSLHPLVPLSLPPSPSPSIRIAFSPRRPNVETIPVIALVGDAVKFRRCYYALCSAEKCMQLNLHNTIFEMKAIKMGARSVSLHANTILFIACQAIHA